ncbi:MAG: hypothetical protein AB1634_17570 [Thermodesulfobacteriota bacterium]
MTSTTCTANVVEMGKVETRMTAREIGFGMVMGIATLIGICGAVNLLIALI